MSQRGLPPRSRSSKVSTPKTTRPEVRKSKKSKASNSSQTPLIVGGSLAAVVLLLGAAFALNTSFSTKPADAVSPTASQAQPNPSSSQEVSSSETIQSSDLTYRDILQESMSDSKEFVSWILSLNPSISSQELKSKLNDFEQKLLSLERRAVLVPAVGEEEFYATFDAMLKQATQELVASGKEIDDRVGALPEAQRNAIYSFRERLQSSRGIMTIALSEPSPTDSPWSDLTVKFLADTRKPWSDFARAVESHQPQQAVPAVEDLITLINTTIETLPPSEIPKSVQSVLMGRVRMIKTCFERERKNLASGPAYNALAAPLDSLSRKIDELAGRLENPTSSSNTSTSPMITKPSSSQEFTIHMSPQCRTQVKGIMSQKGATGHYVLVSVESKGEFPEYRLGLQDPQELDLSKHVLIKSEDITIAVRKDSCDFLNGTTLRWGTNGLQFGFLFDNPNVKETGTVVE